VQASQPERPLRLSQAALETLAVIAYRQPATRAEIEHVRGVDAGAVLRSLLERQLVRIAGHREVPGRPLLYATSRRFLEVFGLAGIEDLPTMRDLAELAPEAAAGGTTLSGVVGPQAAQPSGAEAEAAEGSSAVDEDDLAERDADDADLEDDDRNAADDDLDDDDDEPHGVSH
jgi:segregation and condensation protein B